MRRPGVKDAVRPHRNGQRENRLTGPCSGRALPGGQRRRRNPLMPDRPAELYGFAASVYVRSVWPALAGKDRKSLVAGTGVAVRVALAGARHFETTKKQTTRKR